MPSPIRQRTSKRISELRPVPLNRAPRLSWNVDVDVGPSVVTPSESSTASMNDKIPEADMKTHASSEECESAALLAIKYGRQNSFSRIILQSPSLYSLKLGVLYAAKLNWCDALKSLLTAIQASNIPFDSYNISGEHPMFDDYFRKYSGCGFSSSLTSNTSREELAFMKAAIDGFVQVVHIFVKFIDPNFRDMFDRPFLLYVYKNKDEASRRSCLRAILPKLKLSDSNLAIAAENGDLSSVIYLVEEMGKSSEGFLYVAAARNAIENGQDEVALWIIRQPDLIPWEHYTGALLLSAAQAQNLDMLGFLSNHVPKLGPHNLGPNVIAVLWRFLKDKDQVLYRTFAPGYPKGHFLFPC